MGLLTDWGVTKSQKNADDLKKGKPTKTMKTTCFLSSSVMFTDDHKKHVSPSNFWSIFAALRNGRFPLPVMKKMDTPTLHENHSLHLAFSRLLMLGVCVYPRATRASSREAL